MTATGTQTMPLHERWVMKILERRPELAVTYLQRNMEMMERYIAENFWEEDVERWLQAIRKRSPKEGLQVRKVDFLKAANTAQHHTSDYEHVCLVVRRADYFDLEVYFGNRSFERKRDDVNVVFETGSTPTEASGTKINCAALDEAGPKKQWNVTILSSDKESKKLVLRVNVPQDAIVARYAVKLEVVSGTSAGRERSEFKPNDVLVLFNPFSKDDTVYMENPKHREEYVLNDTGFIVVGKNPEKARKRAWQFAQFEEGVLDSVFAMLQNDSRALSAPLKTLQKRKSPVFVSRMLAAMVNCNDDVGVLDGKWGSPYDGGRKPTAWDDSSDILLQWSESGMKPVKFGQCWVFSGVLTTALRALGIPARSVTNFQSAHDTDGNQTIDIYYDFLNDKTEKMDSIWNFHVWNEAYFQRRDLPKGYDGWQVVDATPQEVSSVQTKTRGPTELMQCGPAPVKAIKEGEINIGSDTAFVFSEVNADVVKYGLYKGKTWIMNVKKERVGTGVATKAVGRDFMEFITDQYKYPEGSEQERIAYAKAYGIGASLRGDEGEQGDKPTRRHLAKKFEVTIDVVDEVDWGKDISAKVAVKNLTSVGQKLDLTISGHSKTHIGLQHLQIKKIKEGIELGPEEEKHFTFTMDQEDYIKTVVDNFVIEITATATSKEDGNTTMEECDVSLNPPDCLSIQSQTPEPIFWSDVGTFDIILDNATNLKITRGKFELRGRGLDWSEAEGLELSAPIAPGGKHIVKNVKIRPRVGWRRIFGSVRFEGPELSDVKKNFNFKIKN